MRPNHSNNMRYRTKPSPTLPEYNRLTSPSKARTFSSQYWRGKKMSIVTSFPKRLLRGTTTTTSGIIYGPWKRILGFLLRALLMFVCILYCGKLVGSPPATRIQSLNNETLRVGQVDSSDAAFPNKIDPLIDSFRQNGKFGTVIGMGVDYDLQIYQRFVGSLRKTGFKGNIILGLNGGWQKKEKEEYYFKDPKEKKTHGEIYSYLVQNNVTIQYIHVQSCSSSDPTFHTAGGIICLDHPLNDWKLSWGNYFLVRQWLKECRDCNAGPVLLVSIQDTTFVKSPFAMEDDDENAESDMDNGTERAGLELYETPYSITHHWRSAMFLETCKGFRWDVPLISSQVIKGDRMSILFYLEAMLEEMRRWNESKHCQFPHMYGDELSIHNYLFYDGHILAKVHSSASATSFQYVTFVTERDDKKKEEEEINTNNKARLIVKLLEEPRDEKVVHSPL
jgi:hypothetical protein